MMNWDRCRDKVSVILKLNSNVGIVLNSDKSVSIYLNLSAIELSFKGSRPKDPTFFTLFVPSIYEYKWSVLFLFKGKRTEQLLRYKVYQPVSSMSLIFRGDLDFLK